MADYTLTIIVQGVDQTAPATQGMERLGVGGVAAGNLLASAMQAAAGAVVGFVGSSISAAGDFQQNMNVLQAASGATAAQMQALGDEAMALGNDMSLPGASASDAATAMLELSKAGLSVSDTMDAAKGTLQLAAAAETDAATAAGVVAGALNAFGLEGSAATQIADQLAAGANASAASMTDLSQGFQAAGFAFNATGQKTDDLIASLSMLTNVGLTGSDAGTALKNAMMQLMAPTDAAAKTMAQYGINVRDAHGNMLPFRDIIGALQTGLGGLSPAARDAALKTMLMGDGMKAMLPLLDAGVAGFDAMKAKVNQAGAAQAMAEAQMQGFNGALAGVGNAMETLQLVIGTALIPILTMLLNNAVAPAINGMMTFIQALLGNADAIGQLSSPLQAFMGLLGQLWIAGETVASALSEAGIMSSEFGESMDLVGQALGLPANMVQSLVFALQGLALQAYTIGDAIGAFMIGMGDFATVANLLIGVFGTTIGGLLAESIGVIRNYAQVWIDLGSTIVDVVSQLIGGNLQGAWDALISGLAFVVTDYQIYATTLAQLIFDLGTTIVTTIATYAPMIAAQFMTWGQGLLDWIAPYVPLVLQTLVTFGMQITAWIVAQAPIFYQQVLAWGQAFVDWITPYAALALAALTQFVTPIWAWIVTQAPLFVAQLAAWGMAFVTWITPFIGPALAALGGLITGVLGWIGAQAGPLLGQLAVWGAQFVAWIGPMIGPAIAALGGLASAFFGWIAAQAAPILAQLGTWAQSLIAWIPGATVQFLAAWPGMLSSFLDWIGSAVGPLLAKLGEWALAFVQWIVPMIPGFIVALAGIALALGAFIIETAAVLAQKVKQWGIALTGWIATEVLPKLPGMWESFKGSVISLINSAASALAAAAMTLGKNIVSGIISGVGSMGSALGDKLKSMASSALSAAKSALGIHSPSSVMADQVGAPIALGVAQGIQDATPKAQSAMLDMAGKLVSLVSSAAGAFGQLASVGTVSQGAVARFMNNMLAIVQMVDAINVATRGRMLTSAVQFTDGAGKIVALISAGADAFTKLAGMGPVSAASVEAFSTALSATIQEIAQVAQQYSGAGLAAAIIFADAAGKIVAMIGAAVSAMDTLRTFGGVPLIAFRTFNFAIVNAVAYMVQISGWFASDGLVAAVAFSDAAGKIVKMIGDAVAALDNVTTFGGVPLLAFRTFNFAIVNAVAYMVQISSWFSAEALAAAVAFALSAGKIVTMIGDAVASLDKITTFGGVPLLAFRTFNFAIVNAVAYMVQVSAWFSAGALAAAVAFADSAGKIVAMIGGGVDALTKLATFRGVTTTAVSAFAVALIATVSAIAQASTLFAAEAVTAAATFADGAGKVLGIIGTGVDGFTKLATLAAVPEAALAIFAETLRQTMAQFAIISTGWTAEMIAQAAAFADGAGKVLGIISNGVTGLKALANLGPISEQAMQNFAVAVNQMMTRLAGIASQFSAESVTAAGAFADAAGKAVGILKNGVEGLLLVNTFTGTSVDAITRFGDGVRLAVAKMAQLAAEFGTDAMAAATAFANAAGQSTDFLKKGVEGFLKLADFQAVPQASMDLFAAGVIALVSTIIQLSGVLSTDALAQANVFASAIDAVITVVTSSLKALGSLGDQAAGITTFTSTLVGQINVLAVALATQARPASMSIGQNIAYGIADGILSGAGAIQNAIFAAVNAALAAARAALGIASPSKVFKDQIGVQMSAGMAEGVLGGMGGVQAAVGQVSSGALTATASGSTTNNNQRSIVFESGAIVVGGGGGGSAYATADAVVTEIQRRLGIQGV